MAHMRSKETVGDGARRIVRVEGSNQRTENGLCQIGLWRVVNFVTGAIDYDARMIAIAADRIASVNPRPVLEVKMIVVRVLGDRPTVEEFVHDYETHAVAKIEKFRRRRIVGRADSVHAELL